MATWHPQFVQPFITSALDADDRSAFLPLTNTLERSSGTYCTDYWASQLVWT